ncbi:unnamed protein product [Rhizophagus irregularis]|uniref:Uncharacterized protein n=1 Tax=Rhizophagus irregularis TaxID=588596 RepID=A0A915Z9W0_9GLOM|nr:hypothetical protein RIR_jg20353.t1 [Rhizophagus irregularis DAOM 181602=DAOM 197198]CAB4461530.1 unnamed protein product [Rhizophagus irregularis]CAB5141465.1 unnamed protein product [Rhizophagus irregularis]CAB5366421.1 unnamed protein product [Rhizophagus irregularis]
MNSFPKKILTNTTHLIISKSLKLSSSEQILQATSSGSLKFEKKRKFSSTFQERLEETKNKLEFVIAKNHESKNFKKKI